MATGDEKVTKLIRWDGEDVRAIKDCVADRIERALAEGKIVGLVAVVITAEPDGSGKTYEPAFSRMPVECVLWAADKLRRRVVDAAEEPDL